MAEIYVFVDSENVVRYVGCSKDARRRCGQHWRYRETKSTPCAAWLRGLDERPRYVIVDEVGDHLADAAEEMWISFFREISGEKLLNVTTGGSTGFVRTIPRESPSDETRSLISAAHKGRQVSEETRAKMREATTARWRSGFYDGILPIRGNRRSEASKAAWAAMTPEKRKGISDRAAAARRGSKHTDEAREKMRKAAIAREERKRLERGDV